MKGVAQSRDDLTDLLGNGEEDAEDEEDDEDLEDDEDVEDDDDDDEEQEAGEEEVLLPSHHSDEKLLQTNRTPKAPRMARLNSGNKSTNSRRQFSTKAQDDWANIN